MIIKESACENNLMLYSELVFPKPFSTRFLLIPNWLKSGIFLILLILASLPLMMFALLTCKLELETPPEDEQSGFYQ